MTKVNTYLSLEDDFSEETLPWRKTSITDMDSFFSRVYKYHQYHGFNCLVLYMALGMAQFVFILFFGIFLFYCVDYEFLFNDNPSNSNASKTSFSDVLFTPQQCATHFTWFTYFLFGTAALISIWFIARCFVNLYYYWHVKKFFNGILNIPDRDLEMFTWHNVLCKMIQRRYVECGKPLTELDVYHIILRKKNYLIGLGCKRLLPVYLKLPLFGELIYWTKGLKANVEFLLFNFRWSLFKISRNPDFMNPKNRHTLAKRLQKQILILVLANIVFSLIISIYQILYGVFSNADMIRRDPGSLGIRCWCFYSRIELRHFNELNHELNARLSRAHRPATEYVSSFSSPCATLIAKCIIFIVGAVLVTLFLLTFFDGNILFEENIVSTITILGSIVAICRHIIPDETIPKSHDALLKNVLAQIHYMPNKWVQEAHSKTVRIEFRRLFRFRAIVLLYGFLSPILTPYILLRYMYPKALEIVDFFQEYTTHVDGIGNICSLALMQKEAGDQVDGTIDVCDKIGLSLLHFTLTNPGWDVPQKSKLYLETVEDKVANSREDVAKRTEVHVNSTNVWKIEGPLHSTVAQDMAVKVLCLHSQNMPKYMEYKESTPLLE